MIAAPLFALVALTSTSTAPGKLAEIRARGRLIVAVKNEGPKIAAAHKDPAHFQKRNFEMELARRIAGRILGGEKKLEPIILPRPRRLPALANGEVDLVISMIPLNDANKAAVDFSVPYYEGGFAILLRRESSLARIEELEGKRIALPVQNANDPRSRMDALFAARKMRVTIVSFATFKLANEALASGKVDALVSYNPNVEAVLAESGAKFCKLRELLTHDSYAVAVKKGELALVREVDATIDALKKSGELARLVEKAQLAPPP